jgi:hypothetical protein
VLGFAPAVNLDGGLSKFAEWLEEQIAIDRIDIARQELEARGLAL